jgi:hypothetical protein
VPVLVIRVFDPAHNFGIRQLAGRPELFNDLSKLLLIKDFMARSDTELRFGRCT